MRIEKLLTAMMEYDHGDVPRIQHFVKVYEFARMIGLMEGLDAKTQFTLESAAVVHDIGIHISEQKYGSSSGKYQELEGPAEAKKLLDGLEWPADVTERVCYLVGHHHTEMHTTKYSGRKAENGSIGPCIRQYNTLSSTKCPLSCYNN